MKQYLDLLQRVVNHGKRKQNRTGIDTLMIEGAMLEFNLDEGRGFRGPITLKTGLNGARTYQLTSATTLAPSR